MPSMASMILRASRDAARAPRSAASAASSSLCEGGGSSLSFCFCRRCGGGLESSDCAQSSSSSCPHRCITGGPADMRSHTSGAGPGSGSSAVMPLATTLRHGRCTTTLARQMAEFVAEEKDLESDEALWALYERWCKYFNEERDRDEMARQFSKFKETVLSVQRNKKAGLPYTLGINYLADGKLIELYRPKVPIWEYVRRMPYSDSVIYGRPPDFLFSEGHKFLSKKK